MKKTINFKVNDNEIQYLCMRDPILKKLILKIGDINLILETEYYKSLVYKIVGQQLSVRTAESICNKLDALTSGVKPDIISKLDDEELRSIGVSYKKINYLRDLTSRVIEGKLDLSSLNKLKDDMAVSELTEVKGIGEWTAEMFLIFSLGRLNILSFKDTSIINSIKWLYQIKGEVNLEAFYTKWSPYNTVASLFLWEAINRQYTSKTSIDEL